MKKIFVLSIISFCAALAFAADVKAVKQEEKKDAKPSFDFYAYFGDEVKDTRSQKGKVMLLNCQQAAKVSWLQDEAKMLDKQFFIEVKVADASFDLKKPVVQGEVSIFIVDDTALPISLIAPESRWAMVNVAPLKTEKVKFFEMRVKKAMSRAFALLCGGAGSQFKLTLTENIQTPEDFDQYMNERLPFDVVCRINKYLPGFGIKPYVSVNYRKACEEGWAAAPTSAVQKAIWEEVHTVPDKPIKIKFDPKKGK